MEEGTVPLPLLAAIHANIKENAKIFHGLYKQYGTVKLPIIPNHNLKVKPEILNKLSYVWSGRCRERGENHILNMDNTLYNI